MNWFKFSDPGKKRRLIRLWTFLEPVHFSQPIEERDLELQKIEMKTLLCVFIIVANQTALAQSGNAELMVGNQYLHYMHSITKPMTSSSKLGWQHIATLIKRYQPVKEKQGYADELMNQAYVSYNFSKLFSLKGGLFYTNTAGYKPTLGIQLLLPHKNGTVIISTRADLTTKPAYELFISSEYFLSPPGRVRPVIRVQAMSNASTVKHNRSYQFIRLGADINNLQFGGGLTIDEFGNNHTLHYNAGFFIRKKW
jgi:hypothetical protein